MITYVAGDLFGRPRQFIAHGVNCRGVMGAGVAKIIREKYPKVYKEYLDLCEMSLDKPAFIKPLLGQVQFVRGEDGTVIGNCFTQQNIGPGKQISYDAIYSCMEQLARYCEKNPEITIISMPKIGAGLGGGEWNIIESIINHHLEKISVEVFVL